MPKTMLLLLSLCLLFTGCSVNQSPQAVSVITPAPAITPASTARVGGPATVYYPEGTDEATATYQITYTLPTFAAKGPGGEAMDAALTAWLDELFERVETERLPLADRAEGETLPTTEVTYELRDAHTPLGDFTNVFLYEKSWFETSNAPEILLSILVFDADGMECNLASISGAYDPEPIAAQQVWNIIGRDPASYYGDLELEDISASLDLYNGFAVADEGYTLYVQSGILSANENDGAPLEFSFGRNAMYPDFVGEYISAEDYEALLPQFFAVATYCGPSFGNWRVGETLPLDETYAYGLKLDEARLDGQELVLTGLLIKGLPGDADAMAAAKAELRLAPSGEGAQPAWTLASLSVN
ncbi:MAG: hypothetical protein VB049_06780 [Candidatus Pelethousia sp.]|nr:hypothetical protein [Candidatus Pelethousia sp.]